MHPTLAAKKHSFTDWSGRTFNCSVFEYALWTKDIKYLLLSCLPKNTAGETIRMELQKQAQDMLANGLSYQLEGKSYQETFFSLEPLKQALKTYIDNFGNGTGQKKINIGVLLWGENSCFYPRISVSIIVKNHFVAKHTLLCQTS